MFQTLKALITLSIPLMAVCLIFNAGILQTYKEARSVKVSRAPAIEVKTGYKFTKTSL